MASANDFLTQQEFTKGVNVITPLDKTVTVGGDKDTYYPVSFITTYYTGAIEVLKHTHSGGSYDGWMRMLLRVGNHWWGGYPQYYNLIFLEQQKTFVGGVEMSLNSAWAGLVLYLRGGGRSYTIKSNDLSINTEITVSLKAVNLGTQTFSPLTTPDKIIPTRASPIVAFGSVTNGSLNHPLFDTTQGGLTVTKLDTGKYRFYDGTTGIYPGTKCYVFITCFETQNISCVCDNISMVFRNASNVIIDPEGFYFQILK